MAVGKTASDCFGIEVSHEAVACARNNFPKIRVQQQDVSHMSVEETFDLVICNFVLHWLDRTQLLQAVAGIDALTNLGVFSPKRFFARFQSKTMVSSSAG